MKSKGIDSTDIQLLNLLQCDARLTHKEMSYEINKSLSAVQVRIRHLQQNGYIKKFVTLLDRNKINMDLAV
ncbi:MAG: winged helix-turn-helix transcriptional regulator, partial [Pedobacter sp.]